MEVSVASVSAGAQAQIQGQVELKVAAKVNDLAEQQGQQLVDMLESVPAPTELSGLNINVHA